MNDFIEHDAFTDPGPHAAALDAVAPGVEAAIAAAQGLFVHDASLALYGRDPSELDADSRRTLPVAERLARILSRCDAPITHARPPREREIGTCRDYALMTCAMLRHKGVPARLRCGFARYFSPGRYEDHWLCEHWRAGEGRWARADAQLDAEHRENLGVDFDPADAPADQFVDAAEAWRLTRAGARDARLFGHGEAAGEWFLWVNLARDHTALRGAATSPWDDWRAAPRRALDPSDRGRCDALAAGILALAGGRASPAAAPSPFWSGPSGA